MGKSEQKVVYQSCSGKGFKFRRFCIQKTVLRQLSFFIFW